MSSRPTAKPLQKTGPGLPLEDMPREQPGTPDGALTKEYLAIAYDPEMAEWLREFCRKFHWSHGDLAKPLRVKNSQVTNYLRTKGPQGKWQEVQIQAKDFRFGIELKQAMQKPMLKVAAAGQTAAQQGVTLHETFATKLMHSYLEETRGEGILSINIGKAGVGKTSAQQLYVERHPNTLHFTAWRGERSESAILSALESQLPRIDTRRKYASRAVRVRDTLRAVKPLIIIDDAQELSRPALELLVRLHDQTGCPMALVGNPNILDHLRRLDPQAPGQEDQQYQSRALKLNVVTLSGDEAIPAATREPHEREMARLMIADFFPESEEAVTALEDLAVQVLRGMGHGRALWARLNTLRRLLQKESYARVPLIDAWDDASERSMQSEAVAVYQGKASSQSLYSEAHRSQ